MPAIQLRSTPRLVVWVIVLQAHVAELLLLERVLQRVADVAALAPVELVEGEEGEVAAEEVDVEGEVAAEVVVEGAERRRLLRFHDVMNSRSGCALACLPYAMTCFSS